MHWMQATTALAALLVVLWLCPALNATFFTVTNTNDSGPGSLREAIVQANSHQGPHTVSMSGLSGRIELQSGLPPITVNVTINGPGADVLTLTRAPFIPERVLGFALNLVVEDFFTVLPSAELELNDVSVTHARHMEWRLMTLEAGGTARIQDCILERTSGIFSRGDLALSDCIVRRNTATPFLISFETSSQLHCKRVLFIDNSNNTAYLNGAWISLAGAIAVYGNGLIEECQFIRNFGGHQAGAVFSRGNLTIRDSVFRGNSTGTNMNVQHLSGGGALFAETGVEMKLLVERTTFEQNSGSASGGAVYLRNCDAEFRDCTFQGNASLGLANDGGAFYSKDSIVQIHNCTFHGNSTASPTGRGGGLFFESGPVPAPSSVEIVFSTITGNTALGGGGGIFANGPYVIQLRSSVISGNTSNVNEDLDRLAGLFVSGGYNFIGNVGASGFQALATDQAGSPQAVLDAQLGPLQLNGGATSTRMPEWGSPLIDQGTVHQVIQSDQRGNSRTHNFSQVPNASGGNGSDVGSLERQQRGTLRVSAPSLELEVAAESMQSEPVALVCEALDVAGAIDISVLPPFEVSLSAFAGFGPVVTTTQPDASGNVAATTVFVRYAPSAGHEHAERLVLIAIDAEPIEVALHGRVLSAVPGTIFATFSQEEFSPSIKPYIVSGVNLTGPITIETAPPFYVSLDPSVLISTNPTSSAVTLNPVNGVVRPTTIWFNHGIADGSTHAGTITHRSPGAPTVTTIVTGGGFVPPTASPIQVSTGGLALTTGSLHAPSSEQSYTVSGSGLSAPVTINVEPPFEVSFTSGVGFSQSLVTPAPVGGTLAPQLVYLRYVPHEGLHHGATVMHSSPGVYSESFALKGSVMVFGPPPGVISAGTVPLSFQTNAFNSPSNEQSYIVTGTDLLAGVTLSAAWPFEVSLTSGSGFGPTAVTPAPSHGVLPPTTVYVRYHPVHGVNHQGVIAHYVHGATRELLSLSGVVNLPPVVQVNTSSLSFQALGWGNPTTEQSYSVSGSGLSAPISINVPAPFEVSLTSGSGFSQSVATAMPVQTMIPQTTVYVRYNPSSGNNHAEDISHNSPGATASFLALTGNVTLPGPIMLSGALSPFVSPATGLPSAEQSYTVSGSSLLAAITVTAPPAFEVSLTSGVGFGASVVTADPVAGSVAATTIFVRYLPQSGFSHLDQVGHTSLQAAAVGLNVEGSVAPAGPVVTSIGALSFVVNSYLAPSAEQSYAVSGSGLLAAIEVVAPPEFQVSLTPGSGFAASVQTAAPVGGVVSATTVYVRYAPTAGTSHSGAIEHRSANAATISVAVDGSVDLTPMIQLSTAVLSFITDAPGNPSAVQSYSLSGINLTSPVAIVAPADFEVSALPGGPFSASFNSLMPGPGGVVGPSTVYVRFNPAAVGTRNGLLTHDSPGAQTRTVSVGGFVEVTPSPTDSKAGGDAGCTASHHDRARWLLFGLAVALMARRRRKQSGSSEKKRTSAR